MGKRLLVLFVSVLLFAAASEIPVGAGSSTAFWVLALEAAVGVVVFDCIVECVSLLIGCGVIR